MRQDYEKLFASIELAEPQPGLLEKILCRIQKERNASVRRRIFIFAASALCSIVALVPTFQMVRTDLINSGFIQFFSLLFSDFKTVTAYWQSFAMSLLETLPIMSLIILTSVTLIFLESIKLLVKNINIIISSKKFIKT